MTFPSERNNPSEDEPAGDTGPQEEPEQGFDEDPDEVDLTPDEMDREAITTSPDQGFDEESDRVGKDRGPETEDR